MDKDHIKSAFLRGFRMFVVSSIAAATTGITVLQQKVTASDGEPNWVAIKASASTAAIVAFSASVIRLLDLASQPPSPPPSKGS